MAKKFPISKKKLEKFIKQNKTTKAIAIHFKISQRTLYRRIKLYGLKGIRPKGRKPLVKKPKRVRKPRKWKSTKRHIDKLTKAYRIYNIDYPKLRFINPQTLVFSNQKQNPKGKFTSATVWFIGLMSDIYFLFHTTIQYTEKAVPFKEIYKWIFTHSFDLLKSRMMKAEVYVEDMVGFSFFEKGENKESNGE